MSNEINANSAWYNLHRKNEFQLTPHHLSLYFFSVIFEFLISKWKITIQRANKQTIRNQDVAQLVQRKAQIKLLG